jgi:hypothetical protein
VILKFVRVKRKKPIPFENRVIYWLTEQILLTQTAVGLNIPNTENYARIKHFLWRGLLFLFSADFSIITSGSDVLIFYLVEPILFHGDVI